MILNLGVIKQAFRDRRARRANWHKWFAWHPVRLLDGSRVWLRPVYRRNVWYLKTSRKTQEYGNIIDVLREADGR